MHTCVHVIVPRIRCPCRHIDILNWWCSSTCGFKRAKQFMALRRKPNCRLDLGSKKSMTMAEKVAKESQVLSSEKSLRQQSGHTVSNIDDVILGSAARPRPAYPTGPSVRRAKKVRTKTSPIVAAVMSSLNDFAASTSMHGINRINSATSSTHRLLWVCFVLAATCGFFYHVNTLITTYFEYPVSLNSKVGAVDFEFPDVTVCLSGTIPNDLYEAYTKKREIEIIKSTWIRHLSRINRDYNTMGKSYETTMPLIRFSSFPQRSLEIALEDFIIWCRFFGQPCHQNFTRTTQLGYSGCYTIAPSLLRQSSAAERHGLSMIFYIPRDIPTNHIREEDELLSLTKGIRIAITPPGVQPNPKLHGIDVTVGLATSVRLHMTQTLQKNTPTKRCHTMEQKTVFIEEDGPRKKTYVTYDCYEQAFQDYIFANCRCISPHYRIMDPYRRSSLCHFLDEREFFSVNKSAQLVMIGALLERVTCHNHYRSIVFGAAHIASCQPPCMSSRYIKSTSFNSWPIAGAMPTLWAIVKNAREKNVRSNQTSVIDLNYTASYSLNSSRSLIKETLLKLEIFAQSPKGDLIEENLTYSIAKLFSDFGGNLGLWVGVSVLTVAEVLELIMGTCLSVTYAVSYVREDEKRAAIMRLRRRDTENYWNTEVDLHDMMLKNILNVVGFSPNSAGLTEGTARKEAVVTSIDSLYSNMDRSEGLARLSAEDLAMDNPSFFQESQLV